MMTLLLLATALSVPPGYQVTRENVAGCTLMLGPREEDGVVPMRAACHWPGVTLERFDERFSPWEKHDLYFSAIAESEILARDGDAVDVRQIQVAGGISDREVVLRGTRTAIEGGGYRYAWTLAPNQVEGSSCVIPSRNDGHWEVRPHPDGGVVVVHHLAYGPGGRVPAFIVRRFQTSGLERIVNELHGVMTAP